MLATLCVALSLALVALGGSDSTGEFLLGTLSIAGPSTIMGPILDMVAIAHDVEGVSCEELGWCTNSCLLRLFTAPAALPSQLFHHGAIKLAVTPVHSLHPLT
jgi:hypothetical protein